MPSADRNKVPMMDSPLPPKITITRRVPRRQSKNSVNQITFSKASGYGDQTFFVDKNREYFLVELLTAKGVANPAKMLTRTIQEFLALTLLPNRDLAKVLSSYGKVLGISKTLPSTIYDEWVSRHAKGTGACAEVASTAERKRILRQVIALRGEAYHQIDGQLGLNPGNVEHIAFRALPVQIKKPQSRGHGRMQILLAAYHFEQCWLHLMLAEPCQGFEVQSDKQGVSLAAMLTAKQWRGFAEKLRSRQTATGGHADTPIILHTPKGSGLGAVLSQAGQLFVTEDLPTLRSDHALLSISFKTKHSITRALEQVSLAELLRPPVVNDPLQDADMTFLPDLAKLNHQQKDRLINTLWTSLTSLRQHVSQSEQGPDSSSIADEVR